MNDLLYTVTRVSGDETCGLCTRQAVFQLTVHVSSEGAKSRLCATCFAGVMLRGAKSEGADLNEIQMYFSDQKNPTVTDQAYTVIKLKGEEHCCKCGAPADHQYIVPFCGIDYKFCGTCREILKLLLPLEFGTGNFSRDVKLTKAANEPPASPLMQ